MRFKFILLLFVPLLSLGFAPIKPKVLVFTKTAGFHHASIPLGVDAIIKWQMDTMLKLALAAHKFKHKLDVQLETTQLILVHENKVDISYRIDERHFDVEGSYSIRYEVLKKRIDKVRLFNSTERLTQPGTIAIVYAHKNSITTYLDKINEMMQAGSLHPGIEYLDLEQLQGIGKLKAIRVKINTGDEPALKLRTGDTVTLKD